MSWELIGEDCYAIAHEGHLPLDWRTKAKALLGCELGRSEAADWLPISAMTVHHGWAVQAPPGEWWGGDYYTWTDKEPAAPPEGWQWVEEEHDDCGWDGAECARPRVVCLGLDSWSDGAVAAAAMSAGAEVSCIAVGEGWPWLCRLVRPATIVASR